MYNKEYWKNTTFYRRLFQNLREKMVIKCQITVKFVLL